MMTIHSPTRVDFAGGTLDLWPIHLFVGDCVTVNLSIDIFTGCELSFKNDPSIDLDIADLKFQKTYANLETLLNSTEPQLLLVQAVLRYFKPDKGFRLKTFSQSPVGGGLGGSSSLCISLIKAFTAAGAAPGGQTLDVYQTVNLAHNLEAKVLKTPTGTQDYFPALVPGLNLIHYTATGARLETLPMPRDLFASRMLLVYTGKAHHSGINNWQVYKAVIDGDPKTLRSLKKLADISERVAKICRTKEWNMLPALFHEEFAARVELSQGFSSPEIEKLKTLVLQNGGDAVKICGAGGGGCVLVWAEPNKHEVIKNECLKNGFQPINIRPVDQTAPVPPPRNG